MKTHIDNVCPHLLAKRKIYEVKGQWLNFLEHIIINNMGRKGLGQLVYNYYFFGGNKLVQEF
jgi:hypothetical protein